MDVQGLVWHGTTTDRTQEMASFCRDVLGLSVGMVQEGNITRFELANGDAFVVLPAPKPGEPSVYPHPAFGFLVPDVEAAYSEMKAKGAQFLGPVHKGSSETWADAWAHFRGPDGFVYALVSRPKAYPGGSQRKFHELRICFAVDDLEEVKRLYRDGLGLPVVDEWTHPSGEKGVLFAVCPTSLEFFDRAQAALMDKSEVGRPVSGPVALRVEFDDIEQAAGELKQHGFAQLAEARRTPWNQHCLRMQATEPQGMQLTLFELAPEEEEARRAARALLPK
jgi:catechol 2,3-dioxygenase-like lactoylglutathione lyase family enzyme